MNNGNAIPKEIPNPYPKAGGAKIAYPYPPGDGTNIDSAFYVDNDLCLGRKKTALMKDDSEARYVVTRNYEVKYQIKGKNKPDSIIVPAGMWTDLATVKWGRPFYGRVGKHLEAAIVHDWLYVAWQLFLPFNAKPPARYRAFADNLFYHLLMASDGFYWWEAALMTRAVKTFGGGPFYKRDSLIIIDKKEDVLAC